MSRRLVVWMEAPGYPQWSIPAASLSALGEALGGGWGVEEVHDPLLAAGDGSDAVPSGLADALPGAEAFFGFGLPAEALAAADRLRWVHTGAAGVGALPLADLARRGIRLTNSAGVHAEPLAEYAIAALLHFGRGLDIAARGRCAGAWVHAEVSAAHDRLFELEGRTLGIVGYGGIGRAVGRRAAALGMRVVALRRRGEAGAAGDGPPGSPPPAEVLGPAGLGRLLALADAVVLCLPETAETRGLIGAPELAAMREGAILINVSRGGIVDESALIAALRAGRIRGAALDVFAREPLPPSSPLWTVDNVLLTPHVAALSPRFWERETALMLRNVRRYLAGETLENEVDLERGY